MRLTFCTCLFLLMFCSGVAWAERLAVVDVDRIFRESMPGKAAEAHLEQSLSVLQKGMDEFRVLYAGREDTDEAQAALREVQIALERQFAAERLAVQQVLTTHLNQVVQTWFAGNKQRNAPRAVAPASALFAYHPDLDITDVVMREMDKEKPVFPDLPTVTVTAAPNSQATPGTSEPNAPAK